MTTSRSSDPESDVTARCVPIDHLAAQIAAYHGIDQQIRDLVAMRDRVKQSITEALGENATGTVADRIVARNTRVVQHRLSTTLVRKRFSEDDLAGCYIDVISNRLTLVTP